MTASWADLTPFSVTLPGGVVSGVRGGQGAPALLLHGSAGSWRNFRPWLPEILPRCDAIIPDLPGCGKSPTPQAAPGLDAWAQIADQVAQNLGIRPTLLVGLGIGASVALAFLEASARLPHKERPTHLILYAPLLWPGAVRPGVRRALGWFGAPVLFPLIRLLTQSPLVADLWLRRVIAGPGATDEDLDVLREDFQRTDFNVLRGLLLDAIRRDFRPILQTSHVRTLVLVGENDPFVDTGQLARLPIAAPNVQVLVQRVAAHGWTLATVVEQKQIIAHFLDGPDAS